MRSDSPGFLSRKASARNRRYLRRDRRSKLLVGLPSRSLGALKKRKPPSLCAALHAKVKNVVAQTRDPILASGEATNKESSWPWFQIQQLEEASQEWVTLHRSSSALCGEPKVSLSTPLQLDMAKSLCGTLAWLCSSQRAASFFGASLRKLPRARRRQCFLLKRT